jgi:predicted phage terminase large subunit-like protein
MAPKNEKTEAEYHLIHEGITQATEKQLLDAELHEDHLSLCRNMIGDLSPGMQTYRRIPRLAHRFNREFRPLTSKALAMAVELKDWNTAERLNTCLYRSYVLSATCYFEDYLQAIDFNRTPDKRFYEPRKSYLKRIVDGYQRVLDGEIRLLTVSVPKRCGKSQTGINFVNMLSGRFPNRSSLMEGAGDALVNSFYKGCLEYLVDGNEYAYYDIFPGMKLVSTDAKMKTFNLDHNSRFPTVMCRSIDASQVGLSEATNLLYLDDCVESRMEAKNRELLDKKWETISGDVIGRAIEGTPIVVTGTRYSLYDPIGRIQEHARQAGWKWEAIEMPALDPVTDESNYTHMREGKPVFTTAYFREQRDLISAEAWESEFQQQPFEAKGLLFNKDMLNYYFKLPTDHDPDYVLVVCDTAEKGSDSTALLVLYVYGEDIFVEDVVFDNSSPEHTKPQCAQMIVKHKAGRGTFESNNAGEYYARDVNELVNKMGYKGFSMHTKRTVSNKETRIEMASDNIIKHFYFKDPSTYKRSSQYADFMRELTTYTRAGKVPHDDAPDVCSLAENEIRRLTGAKVEILYRPF